MSVYPSVTLPLGRVAALRRVPTLGEEATDMNHLICALTLTLAGVALFHGAAHAGEGRRDEGHALHSATMYGGPTQDGALVYVRNVTNRTVYLGDKRIVGEDGVPLSFDVDTCGDRVPARQTCVFYNESDIVMGRSYAASLTVRGASPEAVRAQLELRCSFDAPAGPLARDNLR